MKIRKWQGGEWRSFEFEPTGLICAGYTGRSRADVDAHIEEMRLIGVPPPLSVPIYNRLSATLVLTADSIQVLGPDASGEVEAVILRLTDGLWVGVGSDHTDRRVESYSIAVSKQMCFKPIATDFWRLEEVRGHWDQMILRSSIETFGAKEAYQQGPLAETLLPEELLENCMTGGLPLGTFLFCGTQPTIGKLRSGDRFSMELEDPVLGRRISHSYAIEVLPRLAE